MTINKLRSWLYKAAKYSGDIQALTSKKEGAILKRVQRRIAGKAAGRFLGWLIK